MSQTPPQPTSPQVLSLAEATGLGWFTARRARLARRWARDGRDAVMIRPERDGDAWQVWVLDAHPVVAASELAPRPGGPPALPVSGDTLQDLEHQIRQVKKLLRP